MVGNHNSGEKIGVKVVWSKARRKSKNPIDY
jgi:hypothetical protein